MAPRVNEVLDTTLLGTGTPLCLNASKIQSPFFGMLRRPYENTMFPTPSKPIQLLLVGQADYLVFDLFSARTLDVIEEL
jgi:hypothetical protein